MLTPVHALLRSSVREAMLEDSWDTLPANPLRIVKRNGPALRLG
jgi:hypothetical protein